LMKKTAGFPCARRFTESDSPATLSRPRLKREAIRV
jgi:hypothetical protein